MMYLFEDASDADLSKFFLVSYASEAAQSIFFSGGNGNLCSVAKKLLNAHKSESLVVYMDLVPNNQNVTTVYDSLRVLCKNYLDRMVIIPLVCAEYYYLRSLPCSSLALDMELYKHCVDKLPYWDLPQLKNGVHKQKSYASFEKLCKLICDSYLSKCCQIPRRGRIKGSHIYTVKQCKCDAALKECRPMSVLEKSRRLLSQYPCVPLDSKHTVSKTFSFDDAKKLHVKLIREFNAWALLYHTSSGLDASSFQEIYPVDYLERN